MITEFNLNHKIKRGGISAKYMNKCSNALSKNTKRFKDYGLNVYKNFLDSGIFSYIDDKSLNENNPLSQYVISYLLDIIDGVECAAIFVDKLNGEKLIYEIFEDFYIEDGKYVECDPNINCTRISDDYGSVSFAMADASAYYDVYGLIVEVKEGVWEIVDE